MFGVAGALAAMAACGGAPPPTDASLGEEAPGFDGGHMIDVIDVVDERSAIDAVDVALSDRRAVDTVLLPSDRGRLFRFSVPRSTRASPRSSDSTPRRTVQPPSRSGTGSPVQTPATPSARAATSRRPASSTRRSRCTCAARAPRSNAVSREPTSSVAATVLTVTSSATGQTTSRAGASTATSEFAMRVAAPAPSTPASATGNRRRANPRS